MTYAKTQKWQVSIRRPACKQLKKLGPNIVAIFRVLVEDLERRGPIPGKHWLCYGKLKLAKKQDKRHCHLVKGKPTYVCCWEVIDHQRKILEVYYVGTHEKAPY